MKRLLPIYALCSLALVATAFGAPLDKAEITEVVNSVSIIDRATQAKSAAKVHQEFQAPNVLRTGGDSRSELIAADQTVTRVGSNTLFSFVPNSREINLEKGSLLFNPQSGKGGGTIRTPIASAAVLGTTMIVSTTAKGGLKTLILEGKGKVTTRSGKTYRLGAGQMVIIEPGDKGGEVVNFRIKDQAKASNLIKGFRRPLPSEPKIAAAIASQEKDLERGNMELQGQQDGSFGPRPGSNPQHNLPTGTVPNAPDRAPAPKDSGPKIQTPTQPKPPAPAPKPPMRTDPKPPSGGGFQTGPNGGG